MIVLASASPRRREILTTLGLTFEIDVANVDESVLSGESAPAYVQRVASSKARTVASRRTGSVILAADTTVVVDGAILGKPEDDDDARRMLALLSGRAHEVLTAIAIETTKDRAPRSLARVVRTEVVFRALDRGAIDRYLASGEHRDKAGAYGIQGLAMALVREIRGSYTNVVGLPAAETIDLLVESGALASWPVAKA
ncbi:MAG: septum formation inhibitor Maf [Deltaproteobacteria bacterium]|nr:septum formation inhibitor Maf [Deltaproteobacteria bacterium]